MVVLVVVVVDNRDYVRERVGSAVVVDEVHMEPGGWERGKGGAVVGEEKVGGVQLEAG